MRQREKERYTTDPSRKDPWTQESQRSKEEDIIMHRWYKILNYIVSRRKHWRESVTLR